MGETETEELQCEKNDLVRIRSQLRRWPNRCSRHDEPLVHPRCFSEIETFLEATRRGIHNYTLPGFPDDCRLLPPENAELACQNATSFARSAKKLLESGAGLIIFSRDMAHNLQEKLQETMSRLDEIWHEALDEARQRLGRKFRQTDYPPLEEIKRR